MKIDGRYQVILESFADAVQWTRRERDAVIPALRLMLDDNAYGLSRRRVTVSTSGLVPAMDRLAERCPVALAVSLHAPNDAIRSRIMPINDAYPIATLLDACRDYLEAADGAEDWAHRHAVAGELLAERGVLRRAHDLRRDRARRQSPGLDARRGLAARKLPRPQPLPALERRRSHRPPRRHGEPGFASALGPGSHGVHRALAELREVIER